MTARQRCQVLRNGGGSRASCPCSTRCLHLSFSSLFRFIWWLLFFRSWYKYRSSQACQSASVRRENTNSYRLLLPIPHCQCPLSRRLSWKAWWHLPTGKGPLYLYSRGRAWILNPLHLAWILANRSEGQWPVPTCLCQEFPYNFLWRWPHQHLLKNRHIQSQPWKLYVPQKTPDNQ